MQEVIIVRELTLLNKMSVMLKFNPQARVDFIDAYFNNNGTILKQELNELGIDDSIFDQINHLSELKMSHVEVPERFGEIDNQVNKAFAKLLSTLRSIDKSKVASYMSNAFNDGVLDYSDFGVERVTDKMNTAIDFLTSKANNIENQKVVQKAT